MIGFGNDFMEKLVKNEAPCRNCGFVFSFEKGVEQSRKLGIESQVVACPKCNTIYTVDLQLKSMALLDDVTSRYASKLPKREKQR